MATQHVDDDDYGVEVIPTTPAQGAAKEEGKQVA